MKPKKLIESELERVWGGGNIEPLLVEYLRSQYIRDEIAGKIKELKNLYAGKWLK